MSILGWIFRSRETGVTIATGRADAAAATLMPTRAKWCTRSITKRRPGLSESCHEGRLMEISRSPHPRGVMLMKQERRPGMAVTTSETRAAVGDRMPEIK